MQRMGGVGMPRIGYHCSHEQFSPGELVRYAQIAEEAGFDLIASSDHFHPWDNAQGQAGFVWSWLGAAMQATQLPSSTVSCPGQRYHPAILAQASATLANMFPGRFTQCLGSGQYVNEHITGTGWPRKDVRQQMLREWCEVMRRLWRGEWVTHRGAIVVEDAKLYTRPATPPSLIGAAQSIETAVWMAPWVDGIYTTAQSPERDQEFVTAFHGAGGEGKPIWLKVDLSYHPDAEEALRDAYVQWRANAVGRTLSQELRTPDDCATAAQYIRPEDMTSHVRISADVEEHLAWLQGDIARGFDTIVLHNVNRSQELFLRTFGERVLPVLHADHGTQRRAA